ncbi:hypothetical protein EVAR_39942_1 [Eumeta japonica]|uniref:Uncharacterized protein n=1 Tax=Eumeta variegata TaxID=151549 RepID=A0A4C1X2B5_EUMVA|nr:hypothetical protein EVAR_39942_1 [Eumeta japonica]
MALEAPPTETIEDGDEKRARLEFITAGRVRRRTRRSFTWGLVWVQARGEAVKRHDGTTSADDSENSMLHSYVPLSISGCSLHPPQRGRQSPTGGAPAARRSIRWKSFDFGRRLLRSQAAL